MNDFFDLVVKALIDRGGAFGILSLIEAYAIWKLWDWGKNLIATIQILNDQRVLDYKSEVLSRLEESKRLVAVLERNNKANEDSATAMSKRTTALDLHTVILEKVIVRLENLYILLERSK